MTRLEYSGITESRFLLTLADNKYLIQMNKKIPPIQSFSKIRFEMSSDALAFLLETTKGVRNWDIYYELLKLLSLNDVTIKKRGIPVSVASGQLESSANSLREKFNLGQTAMVRTLNRMHELGLIRWQPSKVASIAELPVVLGWTDDSGEYKENPSLYRKYILPKLPDADEPDLISESSNDSSEVAVEVRSEQRPVISCDDNQQSETVESSMKQKESIIESSPVQNTDIVVSQIAIEAADLLRQQTGQSQGATAFDFFSLPLSDSLV